MKIEMDVLFSCPENLTEHLKKVMLGEYEIPLFGAFTILDLGANCGAFSMWAAHRFPHSVIHAYEPNPDCFPYFKKNLQFTPGVTLHEHGIGNPGWRPLIDGRNNLGEASLYVGGGNGTTGKHVEIKDPLTLPKADIIKLDIEGAELEVLAPLIADGRQFVAILLEYHNEELRRKIDQLLVDYVLISADVAEPQRGTLCYIRSGVSRHG